MRGAMDKFEFREIMWTALLRVMELNENPLKLTIVNNSKNEVVLKYPYSILEQVFHMANPKNSRKPTTFTPVEFVQVSLDKSQKAQFNKWFAETGNGIFDAILEVIQGDHKLGLTWDPDNEVFIASMTGKETSLNPHKCITMRSDNWFKALACVAYIHIELFNGEMWDVQEDGNVV